MLFNIIGNSTTPKNLIIENNLIKCTNLYDQKHFEILHKGTGNILYSDHVYFYGDSDKIYYHDHIANVSYCDNMPFEDMAVNLTFEFYYNHDKFFVKNLNSRRFS